MPSPVRWPKSSLAVGPPQRPNPLSSDFTYGFNLGTANNGNVSSIANNRATARSQTFTYDELNRVLTAQTTSNLWGNSYVYDIWGNLLQKNQIAGKTDGEFLQQTVAPSNRIAGLSYDAAGNQLNDGAGVTFTYDAENRIVSVGGVSYVYDGDGKRLKKSNGKLYWYGAGSDPLAETSLTGTAIQDFIFFSGKRAARLDVASGTVHYYFSDHLGSASVVTNAAGTTIEEESDYYPWGRERVIVDLLPDQNYKFTGKERDAESGLDFFGARYYSSTSGRFLTPDWAASPTAVPYAEFGNPQSLNLYTYVGNNPITRFDADGHCCSWSASSIADWVDSKIDQGVSFVRNTSIASGNRGAAMGGTFFSGALGDAGKGFTNLLRTGESVGSLPSDASGGQIATAIAEEGGRVGGTMLAVIAGLSPRATPNSVGAYGEGVVARQIEASGGQVLGRNVTVDTVAGRARPDFYARTATGGTEFVEAKTGPTARLSGNQRAVFAQIEAGGATPRGANAAAARLTLGVPLRPTPVRVVNVPRPAGPPPPLPVPRQEQK